MGTLELKNIISQYMDTADDKILKIVKAVFETYQKEEENDFYDELPIEVQQLLMKSREQAREGKLTPHKEVMSKYRNKYNIAG